MRRPTGLSISLTLLVALLVACKKDDLVVVRTPLAPHSCKTQLVELNVDSLLDCTRPQPWQPDLRLAMCACDTLQLHPMNIPGNKQFEHWVIDQGGPDVHHDQLFLDTITVSSDLRLEFDHGPGPGGEHLRIEVLFAPCE